MAGAPEGNKNAEVWTIEEATELLGKALELSEGIEYDFIGEIAKELKTYHQIFEYLIKKFPELKEIYIKVLNNLEANCFSNAKKGNIKEATAIVNLKSNHKWTDRQQVEHSGEIVLPITGAKIIRDEESGNNK